jgi:hypothetical protein
MNTIVNPVLPPSALLRSMMPGIYQRNMIYDPTWNDPSYALYKQSKIVPAEGSLVRDTDQTPLWVSAIDPVTFIPTYTTAAVSSDNFNVTSLLNMGNTTMRLYADYRALPYPVTPDNKAVFLGKTPRFYTLVRYPNTDRETVVSQYFDTDGKLTSNFIPVKAQDSDNNSWYLPRCHISVVLEENEEISVRIFSEDGSELYSALMFAKQSAVVNEDVIYSPTIVGMTVSGNQQLSDGTFFVYEKQNFDSLGLTATIIYDNGTSEEVPVDGDKCILYGADDFISSFSGLKQTVTMKYFRSRDETIAPGLSDVTGSMISKSVAVTVIPNTLGATSKIAAIPVYNSAQARYIIRYWMYFADDRGHLDVSPYATILAGQLETDASHFGVQQTYTVGVDMHLVDPARYRTSTIFQQNIVMQLNPPNTLVKWTLRDAGTSQYVFGQDNIQSRRPSIRYDETRKQYFVPSAVFGNVQAFIKSFYTQASPPYDPSLTLLPPQPTHFVIRDLLSGQMLEPALIPVDQYDKAFTIIGDTTGNYVGSVLIMEFVAVISGTKTNVLFGVTVDVTTGTYLGT